MNELKDKSLRYKIGYWFFMIIGIIGASFQIYKYLTNAMVLNYQELIVSGVFGVFIFEPMALVKSFNAFINKVTTNKTSE